MDLNPAVETPVGRPPRFHVLDQSISKVDTIAGPNLLSILRMPSGRKLGIGELAAILIETLAAHARTYFELAGGEGFFVPAAGNFFK